MQVRSTSATQVNAPVAAVLFMHMHHTQMHIIKGPPESRHAIVILCYTEALLTSVFVAGC